MAACGGSPTGPGGPPKEISITPDVSVVLIGQRVTARAVAKDDPINVVAATWSSSPVDVLVVDHFTGDLAGLRNGIASLTATSSAGVSMTVPVRVAPDFRGNWMGNYAVTSCGEDAAFPMTTFCSAVSNGPQTFAAQLAQDHLKVAGSLSMSGGTGTIAGELDPFGLLIASATVPVFTGGVQFEVDVQPWTSSVSELGMSGTFSELWAVAGVNGNGFLAAQFVNALKSPIAAATPQR
jgi:hypothetical protein